MEKDRMELAGEEWRLSHRDRKLRYKWTEKK